MNPVSRLATFVVLAGLAFVGCRAPLSGTPTLELHTVQVTHEGWQGYVKVNVLPQSDYDVTLKWSTFLDDASYPSHQKTIQVPANTEVRVDLTFKPGGDGGSVKATSPGLLPQWESFFRPAPAPPPEP